ASRTRMHMGTGTVPMLTRSARPMTRKFFFSEVPSMLKNIYLRRAIPVALMVIGFAVAPLSVAAPPGPPGPPGPDETNSYQVTNLASLAPPEGTIDTMHRDPNLQNGWGVAFNPAGPVWVSDNGKGKSTLYDGNGVLFPPVPAPPIPSPLVVTIPAAAAGDM